MKKISTVIILIILGMLILPSIQKTNGQVVTQEEIANKLIRFHVIANSDSDEDQKLKLKVRDEILKYISPKLKDSKSLEESREILKKNDNEILKISSRIIRENNYNYPVKSTLGQVDFPVKEYGDIVLPEGTYEAYRIIIGSGQGKNWWCVMFPPLCFVDLTKGEVAKDETKKEMKTVLNEKEFKVVDNSKNEGTIELDFKVAEIFKSIKGYFSKK